MSKIKPSVLKLQNFKEKQNPKPGFYIKTFQEHKAEHPFVMEPHAHDFYMLLLFTKGTGIHTIDFNTYDIKKGSVFFMSPGEMHSWSLSDDTDGYILFFNSSFYMMDALPKQLHKLPFFRQKNKVQYGKLNTGALKETEQIIRSMNTENKAESAFQVNILRSYLDVLLYKLSALLGPDEIKNVGAISLVPELEILVEQHFKEHQPVSFYAGELNISAQKLNTLTGNFLNKTVTDLISERLIAEAKRLLVYSSLSVSEIAYELNFNDNSYFNRFFKRSEKVTPEQFRKRFL